MTNESHDPALRSWVESSNAVGTDFPLQNLPLGVSRRRGSGDTPGIGVAIGDQILDLRRARKLGLLEGLPSAIVEAAGASTLNGLMAVTRPDLSRLRKQSVAILGANGRRAEPQSVVAMDQAEL